MPVVLRSALYSSNPPTLITMKVDTFLMSTFLTSTDKLPPHWESACSDIWTPSVAASLKVYLALALIHTTGVVTGITTQRILFAIFRSWGKAPIGFAFPDSSMYGKTRIAASQPLQHFFTMLGFSYQHQQFLFQRV